MRSTAQPMKKSSTLTRRASTKVAYTLSAYATVARAANVKGTAVLTLLQYAASSDSGKSRAMVAAVPAVEVVAESARHKNPPWKCPLVWCCSRVNVYLTSPSSSRVHSGPLEERAVSRDTRMISCPLFHRRK